MKNLPVSLALGTLLTGATLLAATRPPEGWTAGFQSGRPELKSISQLAFGPEGVLFLADTKAAAIVALATGDTQPGGASQAVRIEGLPAKLAGLLGTTPEEIQISDLAVNPVSHQVYLAVSRGRGPTAVPTLVRVKRDASLELVSLESVKYSRAELPDAPEDKVVGQGNRQSNPRQESITDLAYVDGQLVVAGLSNEEFASTLRTIPFPFQKVAHGSTVEIYHGAHGKYETRAPIRTLVSFELGNQPQVLAAYTCTPLVQFPLKQLQPGAKVRGQTVAELGNRNRPLDIVRYEKGGKEFLLLANSARGVMKVSTDQLSSVERIVEPVKDGATRGLPYETIAGWTGVEQLDRLDAALAVVVRKTEAGSVNLESLPLP